MRRYSMAEVATIVRERIGDGPTFLTFDIDFIDPAYAPGTGTPEVGGVVVPPLVLQPLVEQVELREIVRMVKPSACVSPVT